MPEADARRSPGASATLMSAVVNSVQEGVLGLDAAGRVTYANPAALRLLGFAPADLVGQPEHELLHRARADGAPYPPERCPIRATLAEGGVHHAYGETFLRKDGSQLPIEYTSAPLREEGSLVGAVVIFADARDRVRSDEGDRRARQRLAALSESLSDAFLSVDPDWRVLHANSAAARLRPRGGGEIVGRFLWDAYPEALGTRFEQECRRAMRDRTRAAFEQEGEALGAPDRCFDVVAAPGDEGLTLFLADVSERKRAEAAARLSSIERPLARRIIQDLVETGGVAHQVLTQVGRNLAATGAATSLEGAVKAFADMGLGTLVLDKTEGQRYVFGGSDLLERRPGSRVATCSFTLGYLSEAISRVHGNEPTLGTEIECQSRGAKECRFVVQVKKPEEGLARRVKELV